MVCFEDGLDEAVLVQGVVEVGYRAGPGSLVLGQALLPIGGGAQGRG